MRFSFSRQNVLFLGAACTAAIAVACGESTDSDSAATGGSSPVASGGAGSGSGGASTGGAPKGGSPTGGTSAATGGTPSFGGGAGPTPSGGTPASTGGKTASGGAPANTGGVATGGLPATGGSAGKGGAATGGVSTGGVSTGGVSGKGGSSSGGATGGAGPSGTGGATGGAGKGTGGSGNAPAIGPAKCECETTAGEFGTVNETIVVAAGKTYDGGCKIFRANPNTLGDGNQDEDQKPVFRVEDGATLRNVVLGASAADGVHIYGDATLENIHWLDIGEDAMTIKESGTVRLNCGSAAHGEDKIFQVNAASDIYISNFTATDGGKFMRQNGDTTFKMTVTIDHCDISNIDEVIYRTDSSSSHVTLTNTRYSKLGDGLFRFGSSIVNGNSNQSTVSNNQQY